MASLTVTREVDLNKMEGRKAESWVWILLIVALLLFSTILTTLHYQGAIFDEVEAEIPVVQRRSLQVGIESSAATRRALFREHRKRFPTSMLRRKCYICVAVSMLLNLGLFVGMLLFPRFGQSR